LAGSGSGRSTVSNNPGRRLLAGGAGIVEYSWARWIRGSGGLRILLRQRHWIAVGREFLRQGRNSGIIVASAIRIHRDIDMPNKLSATERDAALASLAGWRLDEGKLFREFKFADFSRAFGFMSTLAIQAQAMDHHPEWLNVYATVKVWLTTHDAGGISEHDVALARRMNDVYGA
jgi:4a-hydroxytetrahydrobiopterin dehydratase